MTDIPTFVAEKHTVAQATATLSVSTGDGVAADDHICIWVATLNTNPWDRTIKINGVVRTSDFVVPTASPATDGTRQCYHFIKRIYATDFSSGTITIDLPSWTSTTNSRWGLFVFRYTARFPEDSTAIYDSKSYIGTTGTLPYPVATIGNSTAPGVSIMTMNHATTGSAQNMVETWCDNPITAVSVSGSTVTVTCQNAHGYAVSDTIHIQNTTGVGTSINGSRTVVAASVGGDNKKFTFTLASVTSASGGSTGKLGSAPQIDESATAQPSGAAQAGYKLYDAADWGSVLSHNVDLATSKAVLVTHLIGNVPTVRRLSAKMPANLTGTARMGKRWNPHAPIVLMMKASPKIIHKGSAAIKSLIMTAGSVGLAHHKSFSRHAITLAAKAAPKVFRKARATAPLVTSATASPKLNHKVQATAPAVFSMSANPRVIPGAPVTFKLKLGLRI